MKHILAITDLTVEDASLHSGFYSEGIPAMTAVGGFVEALKLRLTAVLASREVGFMQEPESIAISRFAVGYRSFQRDVGLKGYVHYQHGSRGKPGAPLPFEPAASSKVSLFLELDTEMTPTQIQELFTESPVNESINCMRFAGGMLSWDGQFSLHTSWVDALASAKKGLWLIEDSVAALKKVMTHESLSVIEAMKLLLCRNQGGGFSPMYVPLAVGYRKLAPLEAAEGRQGHPGAIVEPVVGLGRVRAARAAAKAMMEGGNPRIAWEVSNSQNLYILTAI